MRKDQAARRIRALVIGIALVTGACSPSAEQMAADRDKIQVLLEEYLPMLGRAYSERNAVLITPWVAPKEVARVNTRIEELYAMGSILEPVLHRVAVEDAQVWNNSNSFVTTLETWDVRRYASGSMELIGEDLEQTHRVRYQMKREGDTWKVLYRTIEE